jgi:hypothetical protein
LTDICDIKWHTASRVCRARRRARNIAGYAHRRWLCREPRFLRRAAQIQHYPSLTIKTLHETSKVPGWQLWSKIPLKKYRHMIIAAHVLPKITIK